MLDDLNLVQELDKEGMLDLIYALPDHCEEAEKIARDAIVGVRFNNILNVVITGIGGSAIGGNLLRMFAEDKTSIPIFVNRDYTLPSFVDEKTLVITSSYSGNTEETLAAYRDARAKRAQILAITTGGELKEMALADELPMIEIPGGLSPRAALGYSFFPLLVVMEELGIISKRHCNIAKVTETLRKLRDALGPKVPEADNPAKQLARRLVGKYPLIYGVTGITDVVAERWKGQFNENAKHPAFFNVFPELNHNEIMGYEGDKDLLKSLEIIILRSPDEGPRIKKRIDITTELIQDMVSGITQIMPQGDTPLERMFYHIMFGDYVTCYLCLLNKKDPTEIHLINALKERLKDEHQALNLL